MAYERLKLYLDIDDTDTVEVSASPLKGKRVDQGSGLQTHWVCNNWRNPHVFSKCYIHKKLNHVNLCNKARTRPYRPIEQVCPKVKAYLKEKTGYNIYDNNLFNVCTCIPFRAETHLTSHRECEKSLLVYT